MSQRILKTLTTLVAVHGLVAAAALGTALVFWLGDAPPLLAAAAPQDSASEVSQPRAEQRPAGPSGDVALGAALATGLAAIGAGIGVGLAGAAAVGAIAEKPEILGRTLIFVGLAEGIAIYGLIISFMLLTGGFGGG